MDPRDYQLEDLAAVEAAWETHQRVLGVAATGLGKSFVIGELCRRRIARGRRCLVLADVGVLVDQLAATLHHITGCEPAIERGDQRASDFLGRRSALVVGTVQSQWAGRKSKRMHRFDPGEFDVFVDEAEWFLSACRKPVIDYYMGHPEARLFGCTATPLPAGGKGMGDVFQATAFNRHILWGIDNGWLVPFTQRFIKVEVEFQGAVSGKDYTDSGLAARMEDDKFIIEYVEGILRTAEDRRSIIIGPTVEVASRIADYLNTERPGCARVLHGKMDDLDVARTLDAHKAGEYQFLSSVNMLTKGYDDPGVRAVFMARPTRSRRLYIQSLGRGTRPLKGLVDGLGDAEIRKAAIASSPKPDMLMVNLEGIDADVRDVSTLDVVALHRGVSDETLAKAKAKTRKEGGGPFDAEKVITEMQEAIEAARKAADERARNRIWSDRRVTDVFDRQQSATDGAAPRFGGMAKPSTIDMLRRFKVPDKDIAVLSRDPKRAGEVAATCIRRARQGLASYSQSKLLKKFGLPYEATTKAQASQWIDAIKSNGWKRPANLEVTS